MKNVSIKLLSFAALAFCSVQAAAQYSFYKPMEGFGIEVSLSNTSLKRLPMYRNAIASLTVTGDQIIGGTAADEKLSPYFFVASLSSREVVSIKDLSESIPGQRSIQSGFFKTKNNTLYAGTIANNNADGSSGSGHLLQVSVDPQGAITINDLGMPLKGEGILAITGNENTGTLYGTTYPSGIFFSYGIVSRKFKIYNEAAPTKADVDTLSHEYHERPGMYLCASLIVDNQGKVYGSQPINKIFSFDPSTERFTILGNLPEVWGRRSLGRAEAWAKSKEGLLYGGNAGDGQLFSLDAASGKLSNLGKPIMMNRLRGLCFAADGKLYGLAGAAPGYVHLFSYDPKGEGYRDMGNPQFILKAPGIEQGIEWRGFQLRSIAASEDGKYIVMGEDEALSQLLVLPVE